MDSETDYLASTKYGTESIPITVQVQQDGKGLEFRVCKGEGQFSENVHFQIQDAADGSAYRTISSLSTAGNTCSSWLGLLSDTNYDTGDQFGGVWRLVSPSYIEDEWNSNCSSSSADGFCWHGVNITLTRTCND